jgi:4-cresol dehydrogenase (hydroxylating) flavoprotein subunit
MTDCLPSGKTRAAFDQALARFADVVGERWVMQSAADRDRYKDPYAPGNADQTSPSAAVAPASVEEVQAVVRIANEMRVPLWSVSTGRNLGYGGTAPRTRGSVVLELSRMNKILEVNEELGYALVEPGVTFFDLHQHIRAQRLKLWISVPALGWGSIVGNALERGFGYTPYGDHASMQCGMEVVLADGTLLRTGMGAMANSTSWQLFKPGFGPAMDGLFMQSNYAVVTKMGIWLMPEPESLTTVSMKFKNEDDLGAIVDTVRPLKLRGTIQNQAVIAGPIRAAAGLSTRDQWYRGEGAMPEAAILEMIGKLGLGYWNVRCGLYGPAEINAVRLRALSDAFGKIPGAEITSRTYSPDEELAPPDRTMAGFPSLGALQVANWRGGRGGHIDFSPISPPRAADAVAQYRMVRAKATEYGIDYFGGFAVGERYLNHIFIIIYDQDDAEQARRALRIFPELVRDASALGYGEYRTHLSFMDLVGDQYAFNDHALRRFAERIKDAVDPNGILSPGKQGIWPRHLRGDARAASAADLGSES